MSQLERIDRDLAITPRPTRIGMAGRAWAVPASPRGASSRPRPVQEACRVGFVALPSACAAAEAAFLLWG